MVSEYFYSYQKHEKPMSTSLEIFTASSYLKTATNAEHNIP